MNNSYDQDVINALQDKNIILVRLVEGEIVERTEWMNEQEATCHPCYIQVDDEGLFIWTSMQRKEFNEISSGEYIL